MQHPPESSKKVLRPRLRRLEVDTPGKRAGKETGVKVFSRANAAAADDDDADDDIAEDIVILPEEDERMKPVHDAIEMETSPHSLQSLKSKLQSGELVSLREMYPQHMNWNGESIQLNVDSDWDLTWETCDRALRKVKTRLSYLETSDGSQKRVIADVELSNASDLRIRQCELERIQRLLLDGMKNWRAYTNARENQLYGKKYPEKDIVDVVEKYEDTVERARFDAEFHSYMRRKEAETTRRPATDQDVRRATESFRALVQASQKTYEQEHSAVDHELRSARLDEEFVRWQQRRGYRPRSVDGTVSSYAARSVSPVTDLMTGLEVSKRSANPATATVEVVDRYNARSRSGSGGGAKKGTGSDAHGTPVTETPLAAAIFAADAGAMMPETFSDSDSDLDSATYSEDGDLGLDDPAAAATATAATSAPVRQRLTKEDEQRCAEELLHVFDMLNAELLDSIDGPLVVDTDLPLHLHDRRGIGTSPLPLDSPALRAANAMDVADGVGSSGVPLLALDTSAFDDDDMVVFDGGSVSSRPVSSMSHRSAAPSSRMSAAVSPVAGGTSGEEEELTSAISRITEKDATRGILAHFYGEMQSNIGLLAGEEKSYGESNGKRKRPFSARARPVIEGPEALEAHRLAVRAAKRPTTAGRAGRRDPPLPTTTAAGSKHAGSLASSQERSTKRPRRKQLAGAEPAGHIESAALLSVAVAAVARSADHWDLKLGEVIGSGASGSVYKAHIRETGDVVAVKCIRTKSSAPAIRRMLEMELTLWQNFHHAHVVEFLGCQHDPITGEYRLVLEYCDGGSLSDAIRTQKRVTNAGFSETVVCGYVAQVVDAVEYLHANHIIHRDLKPSNILLAKDGTVKLTDFGCAKRLIDMQNVKGESVVGTPNYCAPEVIMAQEYSLTADVWSLGCTMLELLTAEAPYARAKGMSCLVHMVKNEHPPLPEERCSAECLNFLKLCFTRDPKARPSMGDLRQHDFLRKRLPSSL